MKKSLLYPICIALVSLLFASCNPNEGGGGNTSVVSAISGKITDMPDGEDWTINLVTYINGEETLASAPVSADGSFSLKLPASLDDSYMASVIEVFEDQFEGISEEVAITGEDVLMSEPGRMYLELYQGDEYYDDVCYEYLDETTTRETHVEGMLCYVAGSASATGSITAYYTDYILDINFRKGWNWMFSVDERNGDDVPTKLTTKTPAGLQFVYGGL